MSRPEPPAESDWEAAYIQRRADRIAALILYGDYPLVDIAIERSNLRREVRRLFPDRLDAYDRIYESRFDRFIQQWRPGARVPSSRGGNW